MVLPRNGSNDEEWHSSFVSFLEALADRRHDRVKQRIDSNTTDHLMMRCKGEAGVEPTNIPQLEAGDIGEKRDEGAESNPASGILSTTSYKRRGSNMKGTGGDTALGIDTEQD
ncbi:hypothetical protein SUGI_0548050 [Cryptomeria japonica]|nr:hypothetical protein SUGI_0548050 [Cryptomeria japonica]